MAIPTANQTMSGFAILPEFRSEFTSNNTNPGTEKKRSMQPIMIGRKSPRWPVAIDHFDHFGHFMRAFLYRRY